MQDTDFIARFTSGELPPAGFDHESHLRAACLLLRDRPFLEACIAMRDGLGSIARQAGRPQLYHETLTVAFMAIVADRMTGCVGDWRALVATHPDLFDRALLGTHYSPERLASPEARRTFLLPDRAGAPR